MPEKAPNLILLGTVAKLSSLGRMGNLMLGVAGCASALSSPASCICISLHAASGTAGMGSQSLYPITQGRLDLEELETRWLGGIAPCARTAYYVVALLFLQPAAIGSAHSALLEVRQEPAPRG